MDAVCILPEMLLTQLDMQEVGLGAALCTFPGSWLGNIVQATLVSSFHHQRTVTDQRFCTSQWLITQQIRPSSLFSTILNVILNIS